MNFLCDEGVERQIVEALREEGHQVLYVADLQPGVDDEEVLRRANEIGAPLVTTDKDFGELVFRQGKLTPAARARGARLPAGSSDLDIGVQPLPGRGLSTGDRVRLGTELEDLLGGPRVDLVVLSEADPFLGLNIIQGELLYCLDPDAQAEEERYILRRAGDLAPYERERRRLILGLGR